MLKKRGQGAGGIPERISEQRLKPHAIACRGHGGGYYIYSRKEPDRAGHTRWQQHNMHQIMCGEKRSREAGRGSVFVALRQARAWRQGLSEHSSLLSSYKRRLRDDFLMILEGFWSPFGDPF